MRPSFVRSILLAACAAVGVASCGGKGAGSGSGQPIGGNSCGATEQKQFVLNTARDWYLFPELLPASIDASAYPDAATFLDALTATARTQNRDRFFSYVVSIQAEQALLSSGSSAGFGISLLTRASTSQVFLAQVFEGSAAAAAGMARGDELLAVGTSASTLTPVATLLATSDGLSNALGPSTTGTARTLRWRNLAGAEFTREIVKSNFTITPVPQTQVRLIPRTGLSPIGHLTLRTFISTADAQLRAAFDSFRVNGVRDIVIDLRYNGGGLVSTAELLLNLLAGSQTNQVSYEQRFNPARSNNTQTVRFIAQPETVPTLRVAFITTGQSASASELVINSSVPYIQTAVIGTRSFGKPVGQNAFDLAACDFRLRLVTFKTVNRNGDGDYFTGFPYAAYSNAGGASCSVGDDLTRTPGDSTEAMTSEALFWLNNNRCSTGAIADGGGGTAGGGVSLQKAVADADAALLEPLNRTRPNELQNLVPGAW